MALSIADLKTLANKKKLKNGKDYIVYTTPNGCQDIMKLSIYKDLYDKSKYIIQYNTKQV